MRWQRRLMIFATAISTIGSGLQLPRISLREAGEHSGLLIGAAVRPAQLSEARYAVTLAREFNMVEPEDALKWEVIHPSPENFDFSQGDRVVDFALRHNMKVRGHTLVWHQQNPRWLIDGNFTPEQLAAILQRHIKTLMEHYRGRVFAWDVVNEAFDEAKPVNLRTTIWSRSLDSALGLSGTRYIERCFRVGRMRQIRKRCFFTTKRRQKISVQNPTPSMPCFATSATAECQSMA